MSTAAHRTRKRSKARTKSSSREGSHGIFWIAAGALVVLFAIAIAMTRSSQDTSQTPAGIEQYGAVTLDGEALPKYSDEGPDRAVGMQIPTFRGETFAGETVGVVEDGRPKVVMFLAHWCPHCQADVRSIQSWLDAGGAPEGVDLYAVSTWADPANPNFPPSEWLEREGWTITTVADNEAGSIATAYGLSGTPMYVFVDEEGVVRWRFAGELPIERLEETIAAIR